MAGTEPKPRINVPFFLLGLFHFLISLLALVVVAASFFLPGKSSSPEYTEMAVVFAVSVAHALVLVSFWRAWRWKIPLTLVVDVLMIVFFTYTVTAFGKQASSSPQEFLQVFQAGVWAYQGALVLLLFGWVIEWFRGRGEQGKEETVQVGK